MRKKLVLILNIMIIALGVIGTIIMLQNRPSETGLTASGAENLKEELGDLLLQVMFHCVIAEEEGLFTFDEVADTISEKMIRRHPHVFYGVTYASDEERHKSWEEIKIVEKAGKEWQEPYLASAMNEAAELIDVAKKRKGFS